MHFTDSSGIPVNHTVVSPDDLANLRIITLWHDAARFRVLTKPTHGCNEFGDHEFRVMRRIVVSELSLHILVIGQSTDI